MCVFHLQFIAMKIEPFAKMSQINLDPPEEETEVPVKFRRNLFEDGPLVSDI